MKARKRNFKQEQREFTLTVSMFLLNQEVMRNLFWSVKSVEYDRPANFVNIGINTTGGKLGTTLTKLRKTCKFLADYLYTQGLTYKPARINFFVDRRDEKTQEVFNLIETIEKQMQEIESI